MIGFTLDFEQNKNKNIKYKIDLFDYDGYIERIIKLYV